MKFDELFEQRSLVASKLKECIRDKGYTKVSFASKADISRPTLDRLLNGAIDNKSTFDRHLQKILKVLNMSAEELLFLPFCICQAGYSSSVFPECPFGT